MYQNFAMLDSKQSQIHFKFKYCPSCFICYKLYKNSCRLSKQWWLWSDGALILRCLIWVYAGCQSQMYLIWMQSVMTLIRLGILIKSTPFADVRKMLLDRTILNLGGVSFVLFDVSLQNKILHCKWTVTPRSATSDQGLHCLPKSKKCIGRILWTKSFES